MKFKQKLLILSVILIGILIVVAGCTTPITTAVTGVTLNQTTMALPTGGATGTLVATVAPATATNTSVTWSSSTPTVATVANGVVTSVAAGTTTITVTTVDGSFTATCTVTVTSVVVISTAAIAGVTKPVTGATSVTTITAATQYTGTVTWSPTATTFAASTVYTATITLTPKTGYTLTGVTANLFTVSGATTDTNPVNSGIVTAVFPATAATITTAAILGVTAPATGATPVTTITAATQYTGTVTWSPTATTFAASTAYTAIITLTPTTGYTLTGVAANLFTVSGATTDTNSANSGVVTAVFAATAASSSTSPDATKLFVSAKTTKAKYTALPTGATVKVYSHATNSSADALTAGARCTITLNNEDTAYSGITTGDYIFFMIIYSDDTTSSLTLDGRLPSAPDVTALASIQATNKNTVTSTAAGTVEIDDKITLYVSDIRYSDPTTVGTIMTFTEDLEANDEPKYTRTNPAGHESALSVVDGKILSPTAADDAGNGTLAVGDKITLTFGSDVIVTANITLPYISWVTTNGSSKFGGDNITHLTDSSDTGAVTVVLTAFAGCVDIDTDETVKFNILPTIPIVDENGRNQVLPLAADASFDSSDF